MSLPSVWFLCRDPSGDVRLRFDYTDSVINWEKGDTTDLDEQVLYVFSEKEDWDVIEFLNALYVLEGFVEGPDDVREWKFKAVVEKIIRAAMSIATPSSHESNVET